MSFEKSVISLKVSALFEANHFCISDLQEIGEMLGINVRQHPNYKYLHALHCIDYSKMPPDIINELQHRVTECLSGRMFNPALVTSVITAEGNDFEFTEDRYIASVKLIK